MGDLPRLSEVWTAVSGLGGSYIGSAQTVREGPFIKQWRVSKSRGTSQLTSALNYRIAMPASLIQRIAAGG